MQHNICLLEAGEDLHGISFSFFLTSVPKSIRPSQIQRTTDFISKGNFRRVALQFPDPLLDDAPEVLWTLESRLRKQRGKETGQHIGSDGAPGGALEGGVDEPMIFVTGDTSYGSCCVDEIAAKHLKADAIVHYGTRRT